MARNNPSNPYTRDPAHTAKDVPLPVQKAKVLSAGDHPEDDAFHTVKIRVYGDQAPYIAPVLTPAPGSVWIPEEGTDVAVIFGDSNKPWVIGSWYALDRVEDGEVDLPDYEEGDMRLGNSTGSHLTVHADGHISIETQGRERIDIDHQTASVNRTGSNQSIPAGQTTKVQFNTVEEDIEELWDQANYQMVARSDGLHRINASVALPAPGQNNNYAIYVYVNGTPEKRVSRQSAVNEELSLAVATMERLDEGDVVDIRVMNGSGTAKDILASNQTTDFDFRRSGI